ncbi:MAG: energy-coupled thiamine transporter ThiT [Clostridia bacterium]|nr:energy-coupled thiamine transporter ThiT [Clostridia bacterium]
MKRTTLQKMVTTAVLSALAVVLTWLEIQVGPAGGSINIVMLPIILVAYCYGLKWGIGSGLIVGFVKCLVGGGIGWGLPSILLDYVLAYAAVGLAGIFAGKKWGLGLGAVIGCLGRFAIHFISGVTIYAIVTEETIAGISTSNAWLYSLVYNGLYMLPSSAIVIALAFVLKKPLDKYLNKK